MALTEYRKKRSFAKTPEPKGAAPRARKSGLSFVVQKHDASRLHYDFRLEWDGVLKSWAVPKGPSLDPADKRLAVQVEDHPLEYGGFEGTIPAGEYGGGTVMLWDRGTWEPQGDGADGLAKGHIKFVLHGARMKGKWALVQMKGPRGGNGKNWLLIKEHDEAERPGHGGELVEKFERSVASRRSMDGIAKAQDRTWRSKPKRGRALLAPEQRVRERAVEGARPARLPAKIAPQLASLVEAAPAGAGWLHEIKFDGYRMIARLDHGKVKMLSRNGLDWTGRFPRIEAALAGLPVEDAILDGEVVHLQPDGVSSFTALKDDLSAKKTDHLVYYVFDLLHLDGKSLAASPLVARKAALEELVGARGPVRFSAHVAGSGDKVFAEACKHKLEGIISKRADAPYRAGRGGAWVKVKCLHREEFVVLGWTDPGGKRKGLGALLLGTRDGSALRFAGGVGTGFTHRMLVELRQKLDRLARKAAPSAAIAAAAPRGAHWVEPSLVAEIQYAEWTGDGRLRHPSYLGLREDKEADEVVRDRAKPAPSAAKAATKAKAPARAKDEIAGERLTHPDKLLYPKDHITKADLAQYYVTVADHMLPHVVGRPLTLVRGPDGVEGKSFYQKHPGDSAPESLARIEIDEKEGRTTYLIADDVAGLVALVQMGALEIHLWGSTRAALEQPDRVIFDLDPDAGLGWDRVVEGALAVRDLLDAEMGLQSFVKGTGGKGLHVVLPLRPKHDWEVVKSFAHHVAGVLAERQPEGYTTALPKKARLGKIFIDYLRNQRGATAIAPYSARARAGAPVAAPLTWKEVETGTRGDAFSVTTLPERLKRQRRDPWAELGKVKQQIPAAVIRKLR